ncbi:phage tail sheath C-terminal domain-containing protein [Nostoc sp.]|uniref:phage tail sheath C-terminal domain-containing protein n=1 Tax=Nostoc sp. TaxID=1180 RepID=UPI002FFB66C7
MVETILPGTYITVLDEGLISAGSIASGNIGIVGTADKGPVDKVKIISSFSEAKEIFGESNTWEDGNKNDLTLIRALELIYNNGGQTVYAVRTAAKNSAPASYQLKDGTSDLFKLEAKTPGQWGNSIKIKISTPEGGDSATKKLKLFYGSMQETYTVEQGKIEDLQKTINDNSGLVIGSGFVKTLKNKLPSDIDLETGNPFSGGNDGADADKEAYQTSLALLENKIINIILLAGQDNSVGWLKEVIEGHLKITANTKRERIAIVGSAFEDGKDNLDTIAKHTFNSDRIIFTAPGIQVTGKNQTDNLPGSYLAAAVAGLIASLPVQASPTNKTLSLGGLSSVFNTAQLEKLVSNRVLAVEKRDGFRVVKGITTNDGAWRQITTRRIVDYAIYGVRSACNPYIGKLNNERVRGAMKATIDAFLSRMVNDEALVGYELSVSATRRQEIDGEAIVTLTLKPTFSIDFIKVTMYLG